MFFLTKQKTPRKQFVNHLIQLTDLVNDDTPGGRYYTTPEGNVYPSVTTIINRKTDHTWIEKWHKKVGKEEAQKILHQAGVRGSAIHKLAENYVLNKENYEENSMPINIASFNTIKKFLDDNLEAVYGSELALYSDKLKVAGRTDLVGKYRGKTSIIDFKTSRRIKTAKDIPNYFIQISCYAEMFYERVGIEITQGVILMCIDHENPKEFVINISDYRDKMLEVFN